MTDDETPQPEKGTPAIIWLLLFMGVLLIVMFMVDQYQKSGNWSNLIEWLDFTNKSLWQLMDLALVPIVAALAGSYLLNTEIRRQDREDRREKQRQAREDHIRREQQQHNEELDEQRQQRETLEARRRDEERYREETVRKYFDDMAYLMVEKHLLSDIQATESTPEEMDKLAENPVWRMGQTRTITVLRRMSDLSSDENQLAETFNEFPIDIKRLNEILDFLRDSGLLIGEGSLLSRANLRKIQLMGVNLFKANLHRSILHEANLAWADLRFADLYGTNLREAILSKANILRTNLSSTNLENAQLIKTKFHNVNLSKANLLNAKVVESNFWKSDLTNTNLLEADLSKVSFSQSNLSDAILVKADLSDTQFYDTDLSGADLHDCYLSEAILIDVSFSTETVLPDAKLLGYDEDSLPIFDKYYDPDLSPEQMERYTNPDHPDFWQPEWVKEQANNKDEDT